MGGSNENRTNFVPVFNAATASAGSSLDFSGSAGEAAVSRQSKATRAFIVRDEVPLRRGIVVRVSSSWLFGVVLADLRFDFLRVCTVNLGAEPKARALLNCCKGMMKDGA